MMLIDFKCDYEEYKSGYFEKKPLLIRNSFKPPTDAIKVIDDALCVVDPSESYLKVLKNASRVDQNLLTEEYTDIGVRRRRIRRDALYRYLADDASLVLNRIDLYSPAVSDICLQVSRFARAQASANAYVSFGREPATDIHWDRHDIFAVQLLGEKRWLLYEPTFPLPLNSQASTYKKSEAPPTPAMDIVLRAGDVLYLPRGWWHRVSPVENQPTFHLAVGAHTPLLLDYLIWACGNKLPEHLPFRKSTNAMEPGDGQLEHAMALVTDILTQPATFRDFVHRAQARERVNTRTSLADVFLTGPDGAADSRVLQVNSRYGPADGAVTINGRRHVLTPTERLVVDGISTHPGATWDNVLDMMRRQDVQAPADVLASLLKRDVVSYVTDL